MVEEIGDWLGDEMAWSGQQRIEEKERVFRILAEKHGVRL
jgi:hypothetical protein